MTGVIVLVRHAEAAGHEDADPGLSGTGRRQAAALAGRLRDLEVEAVWHGPRRRAVETARIAAEALAVPTAVTGLLDDRTPVPSPGRRTDYPAALLERLDATPEDERDPDGAAVAAAWKVLTERAGGSTVAMITHAFVVASFVALALETPPAGWLRLPVSNTGVCVLEPDPVRGFRLRAFDDLGHLGSAPRGA